MESHSKEDEQIKFHIKRIRNYFKLTEEDKKEKLNISDCEVSINKVNLYLESVGWK